MAMGIELWFVLSGVLVASGARKRLAHSGAA